MKKTILCLGMLAVAGCASRPAEINAQYVNPEPYMRQNCAQLAQLDETDTQALASADTRRMARARYIQPSQLKGELEAVHTAERGKNCVGRYNATDYDSTGAVYPDRIMPDQPAPAATTTPARNRIQSGINPGIGTGTGTGTGTGSITAHSSVAEQKLSSPTYVAPNARPSGYPAPSMPVPAAGYTTSPSYSASPFQ
ncbi:hypothetical protein Geu3261_0218_005 [Komagataeibacter europaeus NBRC 3261]|uniref:Lipoprotein n=1 Tax=Komagataeibacter europaeus NBRC 3261 TaxID=1234669 RepID=A0A0D6Q3R6_KOMEU|nr:hypothetical protein [Komagataeibacter europaeus]GAN97620.1 hypothetical protein Geu3261_0218_005 [Komagataeibacter europaeus NBRC 3261]